MFFYLIPPPKLSCILMKILYSIHEKFMHNGPLTFWKDFRFNIYTKVCISLSVFNLLTWKWRSPPCCPDVYHILEVRWEKKIKMRNKISAGKTKEEMKDLSESAIRYVRGRAWGRARKWLSGGPRTRRRRRRGMRRSQRTRITWIIK